MGGLSVDVGPPDGPREPVRVAWAVEWDRSASSVRVLRFVDGDYREVAVFTDAAVDVAGSTDRATRWTAVDADGAPVVVVGRVPGGGRCCGA